MGLLIPQAFLNAAATVSEVRAKVVAKADAPKAVSARVDMSAEVAGAGLCPECKEPMEHSHANGIPILICREHRMAIPVADVAEETPAVEE